MLKKLLRTIQYRNYAPGLNPEILDYVNSHYPNNHNYSIYNNRLIPHRQLAQRYQAFKAWYPQPFTSLLDLGSCKGYFVLSAAQNIHCERACGIDIHEPDLLMCEKIKSYLQLTKANFFKMTLEELAQRVDKTGEPFQTVLMINMYQYLYFGSVRYSSGYLDHDRIFSLVRKVCSGRLIFNNRVDVENCQNFEAIADAGALTEEYKNEVILAAASRYFNVIHQGEQGRYPLWILEAK